MALLIPRIEWKENSTTGDTNSGSPDITAAVLTTYAEVGMIIEGTGIPAGTTILSKTATTITMSANATATNTGITVTFFKRFDFEYPPTDDDDEQLDINSTEVTSLSGIKQTQLNFIQSVRSLGFDLLDTADYAVLKQFFIDTATGAEFRYFPDQDDVDYTTVTLASKKFDPKRRTKKHPDFTRAVKFSIRRVIA